jgi:hypothetical protein
MFLPKWAVIILFVISVGSTIGLLFLLTQRSGVQTNAKPSASTTVVVQASSSPTSTKEDSSASASPLSATAEWKKIKQDSLSISLEYPADWYVNASDSAKLVVSSFETSVLEKDKQQSMQMTITRTKKASSSSKLESFLEVRLADLKKEFTTVSIPTETKRSVDDYDGVERTYSLGSDTPVVVREIAFGTRSYFYTIVLSPSDSTLGPVVDEILKTVKII